MAASTISWTNATWNPVAGCSIVSPGCQNCYAMRMAKRLAMMKKKKYIGTTKQQGGRSVWTGKINLSPESLADPIGWKKPKRIFVNSMSDLFHKDIPDAFIDRVFGVMAVADHHVFQILTKRPQRMSKYIQELNVVRLACAVRDVMGRQPLNFGEIKSTETIVETWQECGGTLSNVWLGTSVEDQERADERIPWLLKTPAAVRFLSCEPLLRPIDLSRYLPSTPKAQCPPNMLPHYNVLMPLHWVIAGGESGPGSRPLDINWIRSIVLQCQAADVPVFVKQLGAKPFEHIRGGSKEISNFLFPQGAPKGLVVEGCFEQMTEISLKSRKGEDMAEWPEDIRVQQFPKQTS